MKQAIDIVINGVFFGAIGLMLIFAIVSIINNRNREREETADINPITAKIPIEWWKEAVSFHGNQSFYFDDNNQKWHFDREGQKCLVFNHHLLDRIQANYTLTPEQREWIKEQK
jgi:hypothetical protein